MGRVGVCLFTLRESSWPSALEDSATSGGSLLCSESSLFSQCLCSEGTVDLIKRSDRGAACSLFSPCCKPQLAWSIILFTGFTVLNFVDGFYTCTCKAVIFCLSCVSGPGQPDLLMRKGLILTHGQAFRRV